jgi:signal transduction histidine kinase
VRHRSVLTVLLLAGTLLLVGLLTLQAHSAWTYHRTTTESVLRDYSRLVADELIRRMSQVVGYRGFYTLVTALQQKLGGIASPVLLEPGELPEAPEDGERPARELVRTLFLVDPVGGTVTTTGATLEPEVRARLLDGVRSRVASGAAAAGPLFGVHDPAGLSGQIFVATSLTAPSGRPSLVAGFEVDRQALVAWLRAIVDARPLLPAALGDGKLGNDLLYLRLADGAGQTIYSQGRLPEAPLATRAALGEAYGGVFDGLTLETSIDPAAASRLVIGGLPRSRLPILLVLLALTIGLLAAAVWQMRRERALARMRSDFVAQVSHELRTPLTQIVLFAQTLLLGRTRTDEERRRSIEIIDQEARRLSHLVDNVLQFSRGERRRLRLAPRPLRLAALLRDQAEKFQPVARAKQVRVVTLVEHDAEVLADDAALRQVVLNLVDNAVKYGPPGQEVRIGLEPAGPFVRLFVEDEGPGVPEQDRERIWSSWQRLSRDRRRAISGTGIGLTVVRELVSRHGGRVWVEGGHRGGARFVVELPVLAGGA